MGPAPFFPVLRFATKLTPVIFFPPEADIKKHSLRKQHTPKRASGLTIGGVIHLRRIKPRPTKSVHSGANFRPPPSLRDESRGQIFVHSEQNICMKKQGGSERINQTTRTSRTSRTNEIATAFGLAMTNPHHAGWGLNRNA